MTDALCLDDLDAFGTEIDDPLEELAQDLYHRLLEPPGSNIDDPDRGVGLVDMISGSLTPDQIKHAIEMDFQKDDRVAAVSADVQQTSSGQAGAEYRITISIEANEGKLGITLVANGSGVTRVA